MSYRLQKQTADTQTILQPNTPAYHTSEQSTLQTPHPTLSLSGPSHNISQYLRRFPSYDLQLTTYDLRLTHISLILTGTLCVGVMLGHHHQSVSAASQPASQPILTTYDLRLPSFLLGLTTTSSLSLSSISLSSQPTLTAISEL